MMSEIKITPEDNAHFILTSAADLLQHLQSMPQIDNLRKAVAVLAVAFAVARSDMPEEDAPRSMALHEMHYEVFRKIDNRKAGE